MKPETADAIHATTLKARELLMTEISEQLEGIYGLLPSGQFKPAAEYPVLGSIPAAAETRRRLEALLADERQAGLTAQQAREKLVKEAAFTWLNRTATTKQATCRRTASEKGHGSARTAGFSWHSVPAWRRKFECCSIPTTWPVSSVHARRRFVN